MTSNNIALELRELLPRLDKLKEQCNKDGVSKHKSNKNHPLEANTIDLLVVPFLKICGYRTDTFDGTRSQSQYKIGKNFVDFALFKDNKLEILVEVKALTIDLSNHNQQLSDYFNTTDKFNRPKFGILTDGEIYNVYHSQDNIMDKDPCFSFNLLEDIDNKKKLGNLEKILIDVDEDVAKRERLYKNTRSFIEEMFNNPKDELVDALIKVASSQYGIELKEGVKVTGSIKTNMKPLITDIYNDILNDHANKGVKNSLSTQTNKEDVDKKSNLELNDNERDALYIIRSISHEIESFDVSRINYKVQASNCAIYLDSNRDNKNICKLTFKDSRKQYIDIKGVTIDVNKPNDIYGHKDNIKTVIKGLL